MSTTKSYDEIIDFIASGTTPETVIGFAPSEETTRRVDELLDRNRSTGLTTEEQAELDEYVSLEHLLTLAKERAHLYLRQQAEDLEAIREGLAQSMVGEGQSAASFFEQFERRHGKQNCRSDRSAIQLD